MIEILEELPLVNAIKTAILHREGRWGRRSRSFWITKPGAREPLLRAA